MLNLRAKPAVNELCCKRSAKGFDRVRVRRMSRISIEAAEGGSYLVGTGSEEEAVFRGRNGNYTLLLKCHNTELVITV